MQPRPYFQAEFVDKGCPFEYDGKLLQPSLRCPVCLGERLVIEILEAKAKPEQGIAIHGQGCIPVLYGEAKAWGICMLSENPRVIEVTFSKVMPAAEVRISNVWRTEDGRVQSNVLDAAVYFESVGPKEFIVYCNDGENRKRDFRSIVFKARLESGPTEI